jgi:hypothetical protein
MGMKFDTTLADLKANVPAVVQTITGVAKVSVNPVWELARRERMVS